MAGQNDANFSADLCSFRLNSFNMIPRDGQARAERFTQRRKHHRLIDSLIVVAAAVSAASCLGSALAIAKLIAIKSLRCR